MQTLAITLLLLALCTTTCLSLICDPNQVKVTVKIPDPNDFDEYEQYLFTGVLAYSIRKYCGVINTAEPACPGLNATDTSNVHISNITDRFAMCVKVDNCPPVVLENAVKESKPRFNGALVLTDQTLVVQNVPVTLKPQYDPAFPTWLIPFIVIICCVVLAAIGIIAYSVYQEKKKKEKGDEDSDSLTAAVYENGYSNGDVPTVTEM